jgi:hypothetical protein
VYNDPSWQRSKYTQASGIAADVRRRDASPCRQRDLARRRSNWCPRDRQAALRIVDHPNLQRANGAIA